MRGFRSESTSLREKSDGLLQFGIVDVLHWTGVLIPCIMKSENAAGHVTGGEDEFFNRIVRRAHRGQWLACFVGHALIFVLLRLYHPLPLPENL